MLYILSPTTRQLSDLFCKSRGSCVESLSLLSVDENSSSVKKNDNEVEKSSQETENINENENENNCDQTEFVENNVDIVEEVDNDADAHEWQESDLWKQTKPITLIKDISKKVKARRASLMPTEQRRRYGRSFIGISSETIFWIDQVSCQILRQRLLWICYDYKKLWTR